MSEREDSLSQLRQQIDNITCPLCADNQAVQDTDGHMVHLNTRMGSKLFCVAKSSALMPLVASIVKAAYEAAAKQADQYARQIKANRPPVSLAACVTLTQAGDEQAQVASDIATDIRALTPASAILGAQITELEARLDTAKRIIDGLGYGTTACVDNYIASLESQLSALEGQARYATTKSCRSSESLICIRTHKGSTIQPSDAE